MAQRPALDLELLRTLLFIADAGSFTKAAERVGRTQSAVTLQVQKLEGLVGHTLVVRSKGGPVEMTPQGRSLVESARAMLKLNDEALQALSSSKIPISVRFGTSSTYMPWYLSETLEAFRAVYPNVLLEVTDGYSCQVAPQIREGGFDLVLCQTGNEPRDWPITEIWRGPLKWITSAEHPTHNERPLPLCLAPADCPWRPAWMDDCPWRSAALRTLKQAGIPYRITDAAVSLERIYAPVSAGRAVTVSTGQRLPPGLRTVEDGEGLPPLPSDGVIVVKSRNAVQPYTDVLTDIIRSTFKFADA